MTSPDPSPNHGSEVSFPRAKIVGIFGVENCLAKIFTCCILKTDKVDQRPEVMLWCIIQEAPDLKFQVKEFNVLLK